MNPLFNTKFTIPYKDIRVVQRELFKHDIGYDLALGKDTTVRKYKSSVYCIIDMDGYLEISEINDLDFENKYLGSYADEISWEFIFHM